MRIAEAANQVRGTAGHHQMHDVDLALAHAASGFAMQYNTVVVLGRARGSRS
jgi:acetyl-CoA C-acetyltransferase